ncbi:aminotransferase class I/II-fold pyridoxal phosphate-dependent enzyme [Pseudonocardia sichuanensis]
MSGATPDGVPTISAAWLAEQIAEPTAAGIAAAIARLVRAGALVPQTRLPTVRALAPRLGVSPATVSAAWTALRKQQILAGGGRQGIRVQGGLAVSRPSRYENIAHLWPERTVNLSRAVPDPALLPDLRPAFEHAVGDPDLNSYEVMPMSGPLGTAIAGSWPFPAQHRMAVNGGYEGLLMLLRTSVVPGEYVAVEDPATPRLLDILDNVGARVVPVSLDASGPVPSSLAEAVRAQPVAFVYEPRSSSFLSSTTTAERRDQIAAILEGTGILVVEDDGLGELAAQPYHGLGELLPHQTVLVRTYSKSHGPDLRLAVMAGAGEAIERVRVHRQFGAGWTSRVLQNALAWLLTDASSRASVDHAREVYRSRRDAMLGLLAERGVPARGPDGLAVWVPVRSEQEAKLVLASHGIAVATSAESRTRPGDPAIRVSTGIAVPDPEAVADALALAVRAR